MSESSDQEKKHAPGERKLREAAEKGNIPRSAELGGAAVVIATAAAFVFGSGLLSQVFTDAFGAWSDLPNTERLSIADASQMGRGFAHSSLLAIAIPMGAACVASLVTGLAQSQGRIATEAIGLKWDRMDIFSNAQNMYMSWTPVVELLKGVFKIGALVAVVAYATSTRIEQIPMLAASSPSVLMTELVDVAWAIVVASVPLLVGIAFADYAYSWWKNQEQLKRTDQELKEDQKQAEGDPHVKAARRRRAREIAAGQGLRNVKDADVVIVNPTHYAVALRYRRGEDDAPIVLAKGVDHLAAKIRAEASRHNIPKIENRPVARGLYALVDIGRGIPEEYFAPVAQILAVVYQRRAQRNIKR